MYEGWLRILKRDGTVFAVFTVLYVLWNQIAAMQKKKEEKEISVR